ncbi:MAG: DUF3299 domain-containing protein [Marinobacter sp.]|uniref:DUF3299 domain-containing protein n=1 Tax=Marinobacter sp. TaxID=50741 RepID=UPI0034A09A30
MLTIRIRAALVFVVLVSFSSSVFAEAPQWREVDWLELMPEEDLRLLENLPEIEHEGAGPVTLPDEIMTGRVVPEMDNTPARIPGFVVPLKTVGDDQRIVEFFLVPYYGACIHVPPPPPNQIIHVKYEKGLKLDVLYDPYWVEGVLKTEKTDNDIASASYAIVAEHIEPYAE